MFDAAKQITVTGTVKEIQYTNPHSWLLVEVKDSDGKVTVWGFEAEGPSTLMRAGIRKSDLLPGMPVTVTGNPMRDGQPKATWLKAVRLTDNLELVPRRGFVPR
jgi:DNA/RNA endonuclease YhcR with UshA esterase domain